MILVLDDTPGLIFQVPSEPLELDPVLFCWIAHSFAEFLDCILDVTPVLSQIIESGSQSSV